MEEGKNIILEVNPKGELVKATVDGQPLAVAQGTRVHCMIPPEGKYCYWNGQRWVCVP